MVSVVAAIFCVSYLYYDIVQPATRHTVHVCDHGCSILSDVSAPYVGPTSNTKFVQKTKRKHNYEIANNPQNDNFGH